MCVHEYMCTRARRTTRINFKFLTRLCPGKTRFSSAPRPTLSHIPWLCGGGGAGSTCVKNFILEATRMRLDKGSGFNPLQGQEIFRISTTPRPAVGPTLVKWVSRVKRPGREADCSSPYLYCLSRLMAWCVVNQA
jgi:hypothetical protein